MRTLVNLTAVAIPCLVLLAGCPSDDGQAEGQGETGQDPGATLTTDYDASSLCTGQVTRVEFATRRTNCWDPELPCTISQNPPWISGTAVDCTSVSGSMAWSVTVTQTGQYETQLRALAGASQEGVYCFAPTTNLARTDVANVDLDTNNEFALVEVADSNCSNP